MSSVSSNELIRFRRRIGVRFMAFARLFACLATLVLLTGRPQTLVATMPVQGDDQRTDATRQTLIANVKTAEQPLSRKITLEAKETPLKEVLIKMAQAADLKLELDDDAFKESNLDLARLQNLTVADVNLEIVLIALLGNQRIRQFGGFVKEFDFQARNGVLFITTQKARNDRIQRTLPQWLKSDFINRTLYVEIDDDSNVLSLDVHELTDELLTDIPSLTKLKKLTIHSKPRFKASESCEAAITGGVRFKHVG